jgi:HK97 family phage major capsid protein
MKKTLEERKIETDLALRSLQEKIVKGEIKADDAKKEFEELRAKKAEIEKEIALAAAPVERRAVSSMEDLVKAMIEKRAITISGNGAINQIQEVIKELQGKTEVLKRVHYFRGPNASTNIPVFSPLPAAPGAYAEGATNVAADTQAVLGMKSLTPHSFVSLLPVTAEAMQLNSVNVEGELTQIFADVFAQAFHNHVLTGDGTGLNFSGIFTGILAANKIVLAASGMPKVADLAQLALKLRDFSDSAVIIMNPAVYAGIMADATTGVADLYKEELIRNKRIEGVEIILTGAAPSSVTAGSTIAVGGDLNRYALAMASEIQVDTRKKVGDTNTYFTASVFANGAKILDKDWYALVTS